MTTKDIEFHNSYLAELQDLSRNPAPQIICRVGTDHYVIPTSINAISLTNYTTLGHDQALAAISSDHEITVALVASDDEHDLAKHLLDHHVQKAFRQGNITTVDQAAELLDKLHHLCDPTGIILYNVGDKLVEMYGDTPTFGLLSAILKKTEASG